MIPVQKCEENELCVTMVTVVHDGAPCNSVDCLDHFKMFDDDDAAAADDDDDDDKLVTV